MSVLTLAEVQEYLNDSASADATELQKFITRGEAAIVNRVGALAPTATVEAYDGGGCLIKLLCVPVITVTSVFESYGPTNRALTEQPLDGSGGFSAYGYTLDKPTGALTRRISGVAGSFAPGRRNVTVSYTAGWSTDGTSATLPADLAELTLAHIKDRWKSQRGGGLRPGAGQQDGPPSADRFSPYVEELIVPFSQYGIG